MLNVRLKQETACRAKTRTRKQKRKIENQLAWKLIIIACTQLWRWIIIILENQFLDQNKHLLQKS